MGLIHMRRKRRGGTRGADERWPEMPFSTPVLCIRQLALLCIALWAVWRLPMRSLASGSVQPAIRHFLVSRPPQPKLSEGFQAC